MDSEKPRDRDSKEEPRQKKQKTGGGFKWKEKRAGDSEADRGSEREGLRRGYRDRSPRRDGYRGGDRDNYKSGDRNSYRGGDRNSYRGGDRDRDRNRELSPRRDRNRDRDGGDRDRYPVDSYRPDADSRKSDDPLDRVSSEKRDSTPSAAASKPEKKDKPSKPKKSPAPVSNEPMIVVNINDRLGTKAAIPCLASDSVKAFKAIVAAHIGRQPHEIMIKRQGERPFKDQLTLEDYGVSSGVQLDLEIDTSD